MASFAETLKSWRAQRRWSQLDLAAEAGISSRHLSFLETGRARPSRGMVLRLCDTLEMPLEARNRMLTDAGFATIYGNRAWSDAQMAPIRQAVERILHSHMPYPGLAIDGDWCVQAFNPSAARLFGQFGVGVGDSLVDLMLSEHLPAVVENWGDVARNVVSRLRVESRAQGGNARLDAAADALAKTARAPRDAPSPVVPITLNLPGGHLSMFATLAQFGTPEDAALEELKIELYFPMDDATARALEALGA
ncbi:MmyB family transcriptional regulator [Roseobacteraceae bacterium S113]